MTRKKDSEISSKERMIIESKKLISFLDAIQAITSECRLEINKNGLEVMSVDQCNVALVKATITASEFKEFGIPPGEIGLDLKRIEAVMPLMKDEITITLTNDGKRLKIRGGDTTYTNALLDVSTIRKKPKKPELTLPVWFECPPESLAKCLGIDAKIQDKVTIEISGGQVKIIAGSDEGDKLETIIECSTYPNKADNATSIYSLDYLTAIIKGCKDLGTVAVRIGNNTPILIESLMDAQGVIKILYLVAPRIEDDIEKASEAETTAGGPPNTDKPED